MKREQMIDRLVAAGKNRLALRYWTNDKVEKEYRKVHQEQMAMELSCQWSRNWVHPKKQYPLTAPTDQELAALLIKKGGIVH